VGVLPWYTVCCLMRRVVEQPATDGLHNALLFCSANALSACQQLTIPPAKCRVAQTKWTHDRSSQEHHHKGTYEQVPVVVSQVPTPLQSTAPSSAAVLWSALMSPNHAKVPLQRWSAQDGPPVETTL
jgi:hypothetical protein